ncbi:TcaA NTF2-like domain-containing protein [Staphylococcus pseudintermedius]|uniref:TcaA NTF2-like domain-containing protein n=1 Tax=Staphylococcus pseudintermedius TaxID=283734 RepID=UPI0040468AD7
MKSNEDTINDYLKNIKDIELGAKSFMEDYTKDLNKAYKESDYKFIDKYIESVNYQDGKFNIILKKEIQKKNSINLNMY